MFSMCGVVLSRVLFMGNRDVLFFVFVYFGWGLFGACGGGFGNGHGACYLLSFFAFFALGFHGGRLAGFARCCGQTVKHTHFSSGSGQIRIFSLSAGGGIRQGVGEGYFFECAPGEMKRQGAGDMG